MKIFSVIDLELPRHDDLLVNLSENMDKISNLLSKLPEIFRKNVQTRSALGSALSAGQKLLVSTAIFYSKHPTSTLL